MLIGARDEDVCFALARVRQEQQEKGGTP